MAFLGDIFPYASSVKLYAWSWISQAKNQPSLRTKLGKHRLCTKFSSFKIILISSTKILIFYDKLHHKCLTHKNWNGVTIWFWQSLCKVISLSISLSPHTHIITNSFTMSYSRKMEFCFHLKIIHVVTENCYLIIIYLCIEQHSFFFFLSFFLMKNTFSNHWILF